MTEVEKIRKSLKERIDERKDCSVLTDPETVELSLKLEELLQKNVQKKNN